MTLDKGLSNSYIEQKVRDKNALHFNVDYVIHSLSKVIILSNLRNIP